MKKLLLLVLSSAVMFFIVPGQVRAEIIYSNLGPADDPYTVATPDNRAAWGISGSSASSAIGDIHSYDVAESFVPNGTYTFTSLALAVNTLNGIILNDEGLILGANVLSVSLMTDNGSKPGIALETFNFSGQMEQAGVIQALLTGSSILHPVLDNGVRYWLLASGGDSTARAIWDFNNQGANGLHSELNNEGWHTTLSNAVDTEEPNKVTYQGAFRVDGDLISTAAVPEPATVSLLGFGLLGLVFRRKKTN